MTTKISECRNDIRQLVENTVASCYGLPEPMGKVAIYERLRKRGRHGTGEIFYEEIKSNQELPEDQAHERLRRKLDRLETSAKNNGIVIFGKPLKTEVLETEEGFPLSKFILSGCASQEQYVSGNPTLEIIEREHSYEVNGYRSIDLLNNINRLDDVSKIKEVVKGKEASAAYSCLDELLGELGQAKLEDKIASKELSREAYDKLQESNASKSKTIELFGLRDEKTYSDMEKLATAELRETQAEIKNGKKSLIARVFNTQEKQLKKAFKSYEETLSKIGALRSYLEASHCEVTSFKMKTAKEYISRSAKAVYRSLCDALKTFYDYALDPVKFEELREMCHGEKGKEIDKMLEEYSQRIEEQNEETEKGKPYDKHMAMCNGVPVW